MNDAIELCLGTPPTAQPCEDVTRWWPRYRETAARWPRTIDVAIACGYAGDRAAWAFAGGYQASLRALAPDFPADRLGAMCVTEENGNRPKDIRTTIAEEPGGRITITGAKRWSTLGPDSGLLLVAGTTAAEGERPAIRIARVPADAPGVRIEPMPPTKYVPEIAHARITLERVVLPADALMPGDGYENCVKPFRTIEDTHIGAAVLAYLVREARARNWPHEWIARAVSVITSLAGVAARDPSDPVAHVMLAGAQDARRRLIEECAALWGEAPGDDAARRWHRDAAMLGIASKAGELRTARAFERLDARALSRSRAA